MPITKKIIELKRILKNDGILAFEDPYLGDMLEKTSYDQVYDEHVYIFSATSVSNIAKGCPTLTTSSALNNFLTNLI